MIPHKAKASSALISGDALGNVQCLAACNPVDSAPLAEIQIKYVARRTRLRPELARVVASLAFGEAA